MSTAQPPPLRILVVDDHGDAAHVLEELLQRAGHRVDVATGFADVLRLAAPMGNVDVLVSDITLPDGSGCDQLPLLRERAGGGVTNAVALTGHTDEQWVQPCREAGFGTVLAKPVDFAELLAAVQLNALAAP